MLSRNAKAHSSFCLETKRPMNPVVVPDMETKQGSIPGDTMQAGNENKAIRKERYAMQ
jgi:hypothetical protein